VEGLGLNPAFWRDRRVFVTGHTGFKGAWLCMVLQRLGASVHGYSLAPPSEPNLFDEARIAELCDRHVHADIRDLETLQEEMRVSAPDVVIHLAAQTLVGVSYSDPISTVHDNVVGTANVLQALRNVCGVRAAVIVTTDKCYQNNEQVFPYREGDALGGNDIYSASKACAEILAHAYRRSFFSGSDSDCRIATARAGNVIGGDDWALDRLIPDCIRALVRGEAVSLRYPHAVRPWQHVLDPLYGYLLLAETLCGPEPDEYCEGWNFGPDPAGEATVLELTRAIAEAWGAEQSVEWDPHASRLAESQVLRLDSTKARVKLGWRPQWDFETGISRTADWYRAWHDGEDVRAYSLTQIADYFGPFSTLDLAPSPFLVEQQMVS